MESFLFCFGYESPEQWLSNEKYQDDAESSNAVWVEASSESEASKAGLSFAQAWTAGLFRTAGIAGFPGWCESNYSYWIERDPLARWSGSELDSLPRIRARE